MNPSSKKILFDADVLFHFFKGKNIHTLHKIFEGYQLCMLDQVYKECSHNFPELEKEINHQINLNRFSREKLSLKRPTYFKEYYRLYREFGEGETACMVYARFKKCKLVSSNLRDIKEYCETYQIPFLTTMDILVLAEEKGILSEQECDTFIRKVKEKGSKLPVDSLRDYQINFVVRRFLE